MRGTSRTALAATRQSLDGVLRGIGAQANSIVTLSDELFNVMAVLDSSPRLRRALTDPSREDSAKQSLIRDVAKSASQPTLELLTSMVSQRWSSPRDMVDAMEAIAVEAQAAAANLQGELDQVEEELFQISQLITAQPELRQALTDRFTETQTKVAILNGVLSGKITPYTLRLLRAIAESPRGRSLDRGLAEFMKATADRRNHLIARVFSAVELTEGQLTRLSQALSKQVGQPVRLNAQVDPETIGGLSVRLADEVIDGTLINRLTQARRVLVG